MSCCAHCQAAESQFGRAVAHQDLVRYRKKGPDITTRLLLELLREHGLKGGTLLDIGAGVGVIHHELLGEGIDRAVHVEAASAYLVEARAEVDRRGHASDVEFVQGDFVDCADTLDRADIVTLDRVVCCYPDDIALVTRSAEKAIRTYVLSVPRDRWYVRAMVALQNVVRRLKGNAFRTFVHSTAGIDRLLRATGFVRRRHRATLVWEVMLYEREASLE